MEIQNRQHNIADEKDINLLVNTFYAKIRKHELLFSVFDPVIKENWEAHLQKMVTFWSTLLLYTRTYKEDPLTKHLPLPLKKIHFDEWLRLFNETVDDLFTGELAENAKKRAYSIAKIMKAIKKIEK